MLNRIRFVSMSNLWREKSVFSIFFFNKNLITRTKRRVRQLVTSKNFSFDQHKWSLVLLSQFARTTVDSWYKTNCDFETAILHYVDDIARKYIFRIRPSRETVNQMQNCHLKIVISFVISANMTRYYTLPRVRKNTFKNFN